MAKKKITVQGVDISINSFDKDVYISLTDIAKQREKQTPDVIIQSWMKNRSTLDFLAAWEELHNPDFNPDHLVGFRDKYLQNGYKVTPKRWIETVNAKGIISKSGRYGGTYAHQDIAVNFCYWLSPVFQLYLIKEFRRLKEEESERKNLEWHISKITDNIDEVRNLLDTIPGQKPELNRLNRDKEEN